MWPIADFQITASAMDALELFVLNTILQITALSTIALLLGKSFGKNPSLRYGVLYPAMFLLVIVPTLAIWLSNSDQAWFEIDLTLLNAQSESSPVPQSDEFQFGSAVLVADSADSSLAIPAPTINSAPGLLAGQYLLEIPLVLVFLSVWLAGVLVFAFGILRSLHRIEKISDSSLPPSQPELNRLRNSLLQLDMGSKADDIRFRVTEQVSSPVLANLIRPHLLLPCRFVDKLTDTQLQEILLHEIAHIERSDALANFLQKLVLAFFWFHPLVHLMDKEVAKAREEICDNYVLQKNSPLQYGETLLAINTFHSHHEKSSNASITTLGIVSQHWKLEHRIRELLDTSRSQAVKTSPRQASLIAVFLASASIFLAGCQIQAAENLPAEQRIAELEMQTRQLLAERNRLSEQLRSTERELSSLNSQDRQVEPQTMRAQEQSDLIREQMSRAIAELRLLLQTAEQEEQLRDIQELTERILRDVQVSLGQKSEEVLGQEATAVLTEVVDQISNSELDRLELLTTMGRLQSRLHLQARTSNTDEQASQRPAPPVESSQGLRSSTLEAITEIQELMSPADAGAEPDLDAAKQRLDEHRNTYWDVLNDFEKSTVLNFYTNYWLTVGDYSEAASTFEEILTLENLREDIRLRTFKSLGQLYAAQENWQRSIDNYSEWLEQSPTEDEVVLKGLSYANYQLERFTEALPYWHRFMELSEANNKPLDRPDYAYLNGIYFTLDMYEEALELTKEMIVLFNHPTDWRNLRALHASLGMLEPQAFNPPAVIESENKIENPELAQAQADIAEGDNYLPLNTISPEYPARAAQRGIEGWVLVSFTVDESGAVVEKSINVVDAEPPNIFDRAAIRAAQEFQFQPATDNNEPVQTDGVHYLFRWSLNQDV